MTPLSFIKLPQFITVLLSGSEQGRSFNEEISWHYGQSADFRLIINDVFKETISKSGLSSLCKVLGQQTVRDRLMMAYLNRLAGGSYNKTHPIQDIKDILWFEDIVRPYTTDGHWRHVLLALYLKAMDVEAGSLDSPEERGGSDGQIVARVEKIIRPHLAKISGKSTKIDWLCLLLWHFVEMLGNDKVTALLQANAPYETMFQSLDEEQKRMLINNCMTYCMSVGEADFFSSIILSGDSASQGN